MQHYTVYLYLETALHVLGGASTHHKKRIQLYLQHLVFVTQLLLSAAIVEELELVSVCCGWHICKLLYMFRVVLPPIIRSAYSSIYSLSTASGISHTVTAICRYRGRVGTGFSVLWVA